MICSFKPSSGNAAWEPGEIALWHAQVLKVSSPQAGMRPGSQSLTFLLRDSVWRFQALKRERGLVAMRIAITYDLRDHVSSPQAGTRPFSHRYRNSTMAPYRCFKPSSGNAAI